MASTTAPTTTSIPQSRSAHRKKNKAELLELIADLEAQLAGYDPVDAAERVPYGAPAPGSQDKEQAPKSTFRIDVYPRKEGYKGKVEHLLSGDKRPFTDGDADTLMAFIDRHRPRLDEEGGGDHAAAQPHTTSGLDAGMPDRVCALPAVRIGDITACASGRPILTVHHGATFCVRVVLDAAEEGQYVEAVPVGYRVRVNAKDLASGRRHNLGIVEGTARWKRGMTVSVADLSLPPGTYRLEAAVRLWRPAGEAGDCHAFSEEGVVRVG